MRHKSLISFMVMNGILTILTSIIIVVSLHFMLGTEESKISSMGLVFLFVLIVTTIFFAIIYRQGSQLRSEKEQLIRVFEHISDGILILNEKQDIVKANPAAMRLLSMEASGDSVNFCDICSNYPGCGKLCDYDDCFLHADMNQVIEMRIKPLIGEDVSVSVATSHISGPRNAGWTVISLHEVSDARRNEQNQISKMITHSILQAQENERKRISRELHDGIGQSLYGALIQLEVLQSHVSGNEIAEKQIEKLLTAIRRTIEDIRHLSVELRPSTLDDLGLLVALRTYFQDFGSKFGIQVNFSYEGDKKRVPSAIETALYRIVQEAMTNAAKYAVTDRIDISLSQTSDLVNIVVKDYGQGFNASQPERRGVGLYSMKERADILGGSFQISSHERKGTTIQATIPIQKEDRHAANTSIAG